MRTKSWCEIALAALILALSAAGCDRSAPRRPPPPLPNLAPPVAFPPPADSAVALADTWYADCGPGRTVSLGDLLPAITSSMSRQKIPYARTDQRPGADVDEWRDCSGTFLRLASYVADTCPLEQPHLPAPPGIRGYVAGASNVTGLVPLARTSRDLAEWFLGEGRFVAVRYDPAEAPTTTVARYRHLIKPGSVLWFARKPSPLEAGLYQLFHARSDEEGDQPTHIRHVGVVVGTERDEHGDVIRYAMYDAGNTGRTASITDEHRFHPTNDGPPFGNGGDWLVGIGALLPPAPPPLTD